jgi:nicotinate phosphoribosyltransferase
VNELYFRSLAKDLGRLGRDALLSDGIRGLKEKIDALKMLRKRFAFTYSEFGTRRRFCHSWQRIVNAYMAEEVGLDWKEGYVNGKPFYRGTSNVAIAKECDVDAMGTMAHELFMVLAAVAGKNGDEALLASHQKVIEEWLAFYGKGLSLILPDTFGSDHTFRTMTAEQAALINGFRQDSGLPRHFLEKEVAFFRRHGVDPSAKLGVPSDGIHVPDGLQDFLEGFAARTDGTDGQLVISAGIGTNFTNDFRGFKALSLVMKPVMADGAWTVKLSDDDGKGTGPDDEQSRYKRVFGYKRDASTEPVY